MEWIQFIVFFLGVFGIFIWNRTESRADIRHMDNILKAQKDLIWEIRMESVSFNHAIHDEIKDFHTQLLEIKKKDI